MMSSELGRLARGSSSSFFFFFSACVFGWPRAGGIRLAVALFGAVMAPAKFLMYGNKFTPRPS